MTARDDIIREAILGNTPADGSFITNRAIISLLQQVIDGISEEDYWRVRDDMVAEGVLKKGGGRGGTVCRKELPSQEMALDQIKPSSEKPVQMVDGTYPPIYLHDNEAVQRPDVGIEAQFSHAKSPAVYKYDSSIDPELNWNEDENQAFIDWLIGLITDAAENGKDKVFSHPHVFEGNGQRFTTVSQCVTQLRKLTQPFLNWSGKAENHQISIPTLPLFVHERHSVQAIIETLKSHLATETTQDLFGYANLDVADQLDAYRHTGPWTNRLIHGDSLQVMNSLVQYEEMAGDVQMIYFDPPYGIKYGSNFQPFVKSRTVENQKDKDITREPEMVKAYRDTWELGLHSYLTYLRDRLMMARNMLRNEGSIFVQISDDNMHHVRELMDEVYGAENFISVISFRTKIPLNAKHIAKISDYIIWYAKDKEKMTFHKIYEDRKIGKGTQFTNIELKNGKKRKMSKEEKNDPDLIPNGAKPFRITDLTATGYTESCHYEFMFEGKPYSPPKSTNSWKTHREGMQRLIEEDRIVLPERGGVFLDTSFTLTTIQ